MISEHASQWLGYPVEVFDAAHDSVVVVSDYSRKIYRLALEYEAEIGFPELFARFLENPASAESPAIIIGAFHGEDSGHDSSEVVQLLVAARQKLPKLRGIFLGDILSEENEISWIQQSDVSPLFAAYPALEHFRVRGSEGLSFGGNLRHEALKSLTVETGGLPVRVLREIVSCEFPALEHLELWLGTDGYGADATVADLAPFLSGVAWPRLRYLGLRDSEMADAIAATLRTAPVLERLESLDLSLGTLGDEGAEALLANPALRRLRKLDLHHHYMSSATMARVAAAFPHADVSDQQQEQEYGRYVSVSE